MSIFFPFNFKPESTVQTSGQYIIPSDKYAFVTASADNGATLTINSITVLSSIPQVTTTRSLVSSGSFVVTNGLFFEGTLYLRNIADSATVNGVRVDSQADFGNGGGATPIKASGGDTISLVGGSGSTIVGYEQRAGTTVSGGFWVAPGDDLNGAALKHVTLYQIP